MPLARSWRTNAVVPADKRQLFKAAASILLAAAWCVFIFSMSAKSGTASQQMSDGAISHSITAFIPGFASMDAQQQAAAISALSFPVRKGAHFCEYAVLAVLASNVVLQLQRLKAPGPLDSCSLSVWLFAAAWAFCVLFACTDEFHQLFVDGRSGQLFDVCVDACGSLAGVCLAAVFAKRFSKR